MIGRLLLSGSAYSPVVVLTGVRVGGPWLAGALIVVGLLLSFGLEIVLSHAKHRSAAESLTVLAVADRGNDVATYLPTFLLPFLVVEHPSWRDLCALGLFATLLLYVSARTDLPALNPWLYVKKLRLVQLTVDRGGGTTGTVLLICSDPPVPSTAGTRHIVGRLAGRDLYVLAPE